MRQDFSQEEREAAIAVLAEMETSGEPQAAIVRRVAKARDVNRVRLFHAVNVLSHDADATLAAREAATARPQE